ncbi:MAG: carbon-nitrogen hydrolase family protein [Rhizobiales bacterium]|nr:carbon-nitrogen hydrolase family protein [Hyphomicrobiales bacterium]
MMKICLVQYKAIKADIDENIKLHIDFINQAIETNSNIIIFPELSITGYHPSIAKQLATNENDVRFKVFQTLANMHKITICIGAPIKTYNKPNIGLMIFSPNQKPYAYLKTRLAPSEINMFDSGENKTITLRGYKNIALAICYECEVVPNNETVT